jgi:CTP:molybdopterin cytidylyltransferase MocA
VNGVGGVGGVSARIGVVILAAGEGRRHGGPKALAREGEFTWLEIALATVARAGLGWVSVVVGASAGEVLARGVGAAFRSDRHPAEDAQGIAGKTPLRPAAAVSWVRNDAWRAGRTGSLVRGLADLPNWVRGALVHQVDFPRVEAETFRRLAWAWAEDAAGSERLYVPVQGGRRGHPIVIGRAVWREIEALAPDEPLHRVVRRDPARVVEVAVADPGIHANLNRGAAPAGPSIASAPGESPRGEDA